MSEDWIEPTAENLSARGIQRRPRAAAIRSMCLQCMGGSPMEVRLCVSSPCPLWPYRMGTDPWRAPMSEEQRAAAAERMTRMRQGETAEAQAGGFALFNFGEDS